jgi:hypothetical protein
VVSTTASYLGGPGSISRPGDSGTRNVEEQGKDQLLLASAERPQSRKTVLGSSTDEGGFSSSETKRDASWETDEEHREIVNCQNFSFANCLIETNTT